MHIITGAEPRLTSSRKHNENYAELQRQIDELKEMLKGATAPVAKKASKAKDAEPSAE